MQPDTIIPDLSNPQSWNRFSYVQNNPIRYNDPSGHRLWEGEGSITDQTIEDDLKRDAWFKNETKRNKCKSGDKRYCSYAENHPVETFTFIAAGLVGGPLVEDFILGGGAAGMVDAAYFAIKPALTPVYAWLANFFTHNPNAQTVSLGSYDPTKLNGYIEVAKANGCTYFQMNQFAYSLLNRIGLAQPINEGFILNQINQGKDFFVTRLGPTYGAGTLMEMKMLAESSFLRIAPVVKGLADIFLHPAIYP